MSSLALPCDVIFQPMKDSNLHAAYLLPLVAILGRFALQLDHLLLLHGAYATWTTLLITWTSLHRQHYFVYLPHWVDFNFMVTVYDLVDVVSFQGAYSVITAGVSGKYRDYHLFILLHSPHAYYFICNLRHRKRLVHLLFHSHAYLMSLH